MDLNGDGHPDILSGSYSRDDGDMAGLFQVLWGTADKTFKPAQVLNGTDGKPLIITPAKGQGDPDLDRICTRAFAADINGDGHLDLVSGNFGGTFALFLGEGGGKFSPQNSWLQRDGAPIRVDHHSDPCLVDWDGDGDWDLVSGSATGGVFLFENTGTKSAAAWSAMKTLVPAQHQHEEDGPPKTVLGEAHLNGPQSSTRVWVDDINGDGKLDLLVGDQVTIWNPVPGVAPEMVLSKMREYDSGCEKLMASLNNGTEPSEEAMEAFGADMEKLEAERSKFLQQDSTGFVWAFFQK